MKVHTNIQAVIKKVNVKDVKNDKVYLGAFPEDYFIKDLKVSTIKASDMGVMLKIVDINNEDILCDIDAGTANTIKEMPFYTISEKTKDLFLTLSSGEINKDGEVLVYFEMISPSKALVEYA